MSADREEDELAESLLCAAREDRPSPAFVRSVMSTLGVGSGFFVALPRVMPAVEGGDLRPLAEFAGDLPKPVGVAPAPSGLAAASGGASVAGASLSVGAVLKAVGLGMLAGGVALGTAQFSVQATEPAPRLASFSDAARSTFPPSLAPRSAARNANAEAVNPLELLETRAPGLQSVPLAKATRAAARSVAAKVRGQGAEGPKTEVREAEIRKAETPEASALAAEVELLRLASRALEAGNAQTALHFLDEYTNQRKTAFLVPEATLLRAKALAASGQSAAAARVAREFLDEHAGARQSAALKTLAEVTRVAP